jgi:DNA-binding response OmpR family regulator
MVEDDAATVESVKLSFEVYLPAVIFEAANNGQEALRLLGQGNFDCVLLDMGLPDIDGITIIEKLRTFSQIPIIVLSARNSQDIIYKALQSGANEYITKPYEYQYLLKLVTNHISQGQPLPKVRAPSKTDAVIDVSLFTPQL